MNHLFTLHREPRKVTIFYNGVVVGYVETKKGDPYARASASPILKTQPWWPKLKINLGQALVGIASLAELPGNVIIETKS